MYQIMSAEQAVSLIRDGDFIGVNSFLSLCNPFALHTALAKRFRETGHPCNLTYYAGAGFGGWEENTLGDEPVCAGAVTKVITGHLKSMPGVMRLTRENAIECYCMPLGVMSQCMRAAAGGNAYYFSKMGLNLFVDPRNDGPYINSRSKEEWVRLVNIEGEEYLRYKTPKIDVALIRGTSVDPSGNISFSEECVTVDALALAQATKANGGIVIVEVARVSHLFDRPRSVIVPGILVDVVVVRGEAEDKESISALAGDIHVPTTQMDYWMARIGKEDHKAKDDDPSRLRIGYRAIKELHYGDVVNLGIGIPEVVGQCASQKGILRDLVLTVESGGLGGLPAPGMAFGATIGADCVTDMAQQFDFYDGGGLDICFMGGLEVDRWGNVNAHVLPKRFVGIGGFGNITGATKVVVFCMTFTAKGLKTRFIDEEHIEILEEGQLPKFKEKIQSISFSAKNALEKGLKVLYITERCVFRLTEEGLKLEEVYDGIDPETQIKNIFPWCV